jgi:nucleoside-diphosphate-sugar epimerase
MDYPKYFKDENELEEALSRPTSNLVAIFRALEGDVILLGVAGKMGVSMARMAKRACKMAGIEKRIIGVSRFSEKDQQSFLEESGIETIKGDLLDQEFINSLPEVSNVVYLAGTKFGTEGNESLTWAMNSFLPGLVVQKFKNSRIVAFSTGCVYPLVDITSGGSRESDIPSPVGEYAQSCLGRERLFEYGSIKNGTPVILIRLNYAVEMRYGVLVDISSKVYNEETLDLTMGYANVIWQGDANEMILRSLQYCTSPAAHLNISGPELISVAEVAKKFGKIMGKEVRFKGVEANSALSVDVSKSIGLLGTPLVGLDQVIEWTAHWVGSDKRLLGKSTHFEVRDGKY